MKAHIFLKEAIDRKEEIKAALVEEHKHFYGTTSGFKEVMMEVGFMEAGFAETEKGFRWLRCSGTYIEFLGSGEVFVSGARHSIDEFLCQFFSREELMGARIMAIESREPDRPIGDTL